jgi:transposase
MAVYVGIDVHKHYCQAALMDDNGHIVKELRFDNTSQGTTNLVTLARSIDPQVNAVVEPPANFWIRIYDKLEEQGIDVKLTNPPKDKSHSGSPHQNRPHRRQDPSLPPTR